MNDNTTDRPAYGREIMAEIAGIARPSRWRWRGRYVPGAVAAEVLMLGATAVLVWMLARRPDGAGWAALAAAGGATAVWMVAETEARVTERHRERRRRRAADMAEARERAHIPDGYVLAYELGNQAGQLGAELADPYLTVAAVRADRWDLLEPLWRFTVRQSAIAGAGVVVQLPAGSLAGVSALGGFFAEVDDGRVRDLTAAERALTARGARDVTSIYYQPPAV